MRELLGSVGWRVQRRTVGRRCERTHGAARPSTLALYTRHAIWSGLLEEPERTCWPAVLLNRLFGASIDVLCVGGEVCITPVYFVD